MKNKLRLVIGCACIIVGIAALLLLLPMKVKAPENVMATYDGAGNLKVNWNPVDKASEYEVTISEYAASTKENALVFNDAEEGVEYKIAVRAVAARRSKKFYSDWTTITYNIDLTLDNVQTINYWTNGSYLEMNWSEAKGATSYEVKLSEAGTVYPLDQASTRITSLQDGEPVSVYLRTVRKVGSHTYNGDWSLFNLSFASYDYSSLPYEYAMDLDLERLKVWAAARGYKIDIEQKDDFVFADVHVKDSENSGFANGLGRFIGGFLGGYVVGVTDSIDSTYQEDFSDVESMVGALVEAGGVKEYATEKKDDAVASGKSGALVYGLKSLLIDTDIHYVYRYNDVYKAPVVCEMYMLNPGHQDYFERRYSDYTPDSDGLIHLTTTTNNELVAYNTVKFIDVASYNVSVIGFKR